MKNKHNKLKIEAEELHLLIIRNKKRVQESKAALEKRKEQRKELEGFIDELDVKLSEMNKYVFTSDLHNTCKYIDPSNQLEEYLSELAECSRTIEKEGNPDRAMELRYLIRKLLEQKIK